MRQLLLTNCTEHDEAKLNFVNWYFRGFVLYGCETWSLTLREEPRLRVFENRVLRRVFEPKRDVVMGMEKIT